MKEIECKSMSELLAAIREMPNEDNSFAKINGIVVERSGSSGWIIDNYLCLSAECAMLRLTVMSGVKLDLIRDDA